MPETPLLAWDPGDASTGGSNFGNRWVREPYVLVRQRLEEMPNLLLVSLSSYMDPPSPVPLAEIVRDWRGMLDPCNPVCCIPAAHFVVMPRQQETALPNCHSREVAVRQNVRTCKSNGVSL